jgi:hypothetical protein
VEERPRSRTVCYKSGTAAAQKDTFFTAKPVLVCISYTPWCSCSFGEPRKCFIRTVLINEVALTATCRHCAASRTARGSLTLNMTAVALPVCGVKQRNGFTICRLTTRVRSRQRQRVLLLLFCIQTSSEAHPASYPVGTGVLSWGIQRYRGVTLTTHPLLVPRPRMNRIYTSSPHLAPAWSSGTSTLLLYCLASG